jgi:predicted tellurium resistance membrane protein TerC
VSRKLFPKRRIPGGVFFWGVIAAFVARGLNPVSVLNLTVFSPLFLLHGSLLTWWWCRTHSGHGSIHASPHLQSVH